uniref:Low specificity L-threonine aldolase n=1 Tax=uncultured bacterium Contigcl_1771 TaxID=1393660 RepID=W0FMF8_9BACT|nr:low specificity L-threonine aldolase [uncultured bacterium Contigcl_1771]
MSTDKKLSFTSDYMEGAHPLILQKLAETNLEKTAGYGLDEYSESARKKIRAACGTPEAEVFFLAGGTQTNAVMISALLRPWQGVISAGSGHVSVHEAGAIEYGGHKVLALPHHNGKLTAEAVRDCMEAYLQDANRDHMVMPGMVYLSHPTEYGTLYSRAELRAISDVCRRYQIPLYLDGARLAYALACPENDITLPDLGRLCDAFYIGGTKCGALFGEAAVIPDRRIVPHLFTMIKQHGALLAKGRITGIQFDVLFTDDLYLRIGRPAIEAAARIREVLKAKGYDLTPPSPTNQLFLRLDKAQAAALSEKVEMSFIEQAEDGRVIMRIVTSWATAPEEAGRLIACL